MTPAIVAARKAGIAFDILEYHHAPSAPSYALEAAEALKLDAAAVFKTLVVAVDGAPAVGLVPADRTLDLKAIAAALGGRRAEMADPQVAERVTGYVVGGISPLGQRKRLPTTIDESALGFETILVSAGRRGLQIELAPQDLVRLTDAGVVAVSRP